MALSLDKLATAGDLYYASNFDSSRTFATPTASNLESLRCDLETYAYSTVGQLQDFSEGHTLDSEEEIIVDNCDVGTIDLSAKIIPSISFTWMDVNNIDVLANMLGLSTVSVTGAAVVGFSQTVSSGNWALATNIALCNQNGDGSAITVTSVTGSVDGLIAPADYTVTQDALGRTVVVVPAIAGTVTTIAQDLVLVYDYTPRDKQLSGYRVEKQSVPLGLYKFVSCAQAGDVDASNGLTNYVQTIAYFSKASLTGELTRTYINRSRNDFAGSPAEFTCKDGGLYIVWKKTWQQ